jgi:pectinesterase
MKKIVLLLLVSFFAQKILAQTVTVARDGSGNYTTIQAAINAAPTTATVGTPYIINVKNGKYYEKITVPSNKPFIQMIGESVANVIVYYDDYAGKNNGAIGTQGSASFSVNANDFTAMNITFANTFNYDSAVAAGVSGSQAVALLINADRAAFKNCRFIGQQDTLYTKGSGTVRHYFYKCYIDGIIDFIFGSSVAVFDSCVVYPKARTSSGSSYITAANTITNQKYGYVFRDCKFPGNGAVTTYYLGRPWGNSAGAATSSSKTVLINTSIATDLLLPQGWSTWDAGTITDSITYAEYKSKNFAGSLLNVSQRVSWSKQFTDADTVGYNLNNMFSGWNPCLTRSDFCPYAATEIAVSNFRGKKGASTSTFDWNISWAMTGIKYDLFRSTDNKTSFQNIGTVTAANDTAINFQLPDATIPPAGSIYYYYLVASKAGLSSHITDTIAISSLQTLTATGTLTAFNQYQSLGTPSSVQSYNISGINLTGNVIITPPSPFEISLDGSIWINSSSSITLTPTSGALASTNIKVRMNASALNSYSGNITNVSTGAASINVAVTGTYTAAPPYTPIVLQQWLMTSNNADDAGVRSAGVAASTPTFKNLTISNGSSTPAVAAYGTNFGQSFSPSALGDGCWSTACGGPNSTNPNRGYYEQFNITANAGYSVRLDSLVFNTSCYNSANGRMAVVYSLNNFTTNDSIDVAGTRSSYSYSDTGAFAKPLALPNLTSNNNAANYAALIKNGGLTLNAGQTLSLRLYFAVGSSSTGRYTSLKNVQLYGTATNLLPLNLLSFSATENNKQVNLQWSTANEVNTANFIVERSSDAVSFTPLNNVASNNTSGINNYSSVDASPLQGTSYYRLKMIDKDGSFKYSSVVAVTINTLGVLSVYPNPASSSINVLHAKANTNAVLQIATIDGRTVATYKALANSLQTNIDISSLKSGNYLLLFNNNGEQKITKFVKL